MECLRDTSPDVRRRSRSAPRAPTGTASTRPSSRPSRASRSRRWRPPADAAGVERMGRLPQHDRPHGEPLATTDEAQGAGDEPGAPRARRARLRVGLRHRHRAGVVPARARRERDSRHLRQEGGARVADSTGASRRTALARDARGGARLGARSDFPPIDYQASATTRRPSRTTPAEEPGRGRPRAARDLREARHPARGAEGAGRGRRRRRLRQRLGRHHLQEKLGEMGIIFCSFSEAVKEHPELVKKYLGSVVPAGRQLLRGAQLGGVQRRSFVYIPKGVRCPMELSTYFRINAANTGSVRAHPDRRGRGQRTSATSRAARRPCATRTSCTRRWSS